jgi:glycosyltransferase involved in cell wall biosynthesis
VRALIVLAKRPDPGAKDAVARGEHPRIEYLELQRRLAADLVDYHTVDASPSTAVWALKRWLGDRWALAFLAAPRARYYDDLYATGEDVGLPLAMMLKALRLRRRLTMVVHNADTRKRRALFRAVGENVLRHIIVLATAQREILTHLSRLPPEKVHFLPNWIDHRYFGPSSDELGAFALSVGMEQRDYPTLFDAALGQPWRFHIVGSGFSPGTGYAPASGLREQEGFSLGGGCSYPELRSLYQRARLVVVPLKPATYAAGVTCLVEAMAMGKAIIAAETAGLRDYIKRDISAFLYRAGDSQALRGVLERAWPDEARLRAMGAHNRRWIEADINVEQYAERVARLLGY